MKHRPGVLREAIDLMSSFAARTGLTTDAPKRRYLWTDAFAVCNFIGLAGITGDDRYQRLAVRLVDQVHHVLGRYRTDDARTGWLSGLDEEEGQAHPTRGGLRIGKPLPERGLREPLNERLEWERDGQYFHYLTKWMHALSQVHRSTGDPRYHTWACELAKAAHDAFVYHDESGLRMVWKMSTDLSRPIVPSMGHHDPLDGFITCVELETTRPERSEGPNLTHESAVFESMAAGRDWSTPDPLGLGGLLMDASRVSQLMKFGAFKDGKLLAALLSAALRGMADYRRRNELAYPASQRLAFRELGLAIGLEALEFIEQQTLGEYRDGAEPLRHARELAGYVELGSRITSFWLASGHRAGPTWSQHRDINEVMLATTLVPDGFLRIGRSGRSCGTERPD